MYTFVFKYLFTQGVELFSADSVDLSKADSANDESGDTKEEVKNGAEDETKVATETDKVDIDADTDMKDDDVQIVTTEKPEDNVIEIDDEPDQEAEKASTQVHIAILLANKHHFIEFRRTT